MTCPRCKCPECRKTELNAVLSRRIVSREADIDTFGGPRPRRFLEPRELGKPPVDPDAEQLAGVNDNTPDIADARLAADVREIVAEMEGRG